MILRVSANEILVLYNQNKGLLILQANTNWLKSPLSPTCHENSFFSCLHWKALKKKLMTWFWGSPSLNQWCCVNINSDNKKQQKFKFGRLQNDMNDSWRDYRKFLVMSYRLCKNCRIIRFTYLQGVTKKCPFTRR